MYKAFYAGMEQTLPLFAFLFFVAVFVGVTVRVLALRKSSDFTHDERLPLSDDEVTR
jgi:cbb3-type cytochrome oxidase subunit 3